MSRGGELAMTKSDIELMLESLSQAVCATLRYAPTARLRRRRAPSRQALERAGLFRSLRRSVLAGRRGAGKMRGAEPHGMITIERRNTRPPRRGGATAGSSVATSRRPIQV
ncbi:hypothetical protein RPC_4083 [Rhodopseudomonas palustris BisB18]|uniref:Uncharacterized protein n=1 Tax=Rhodopseudomonas palustris (strain BisB18) TaxID=316056 RepID=Q20Z27_RHOPB